MKRIDKFLLRSYLGPFILTFFISEFILLMQFVWKYVDELIGKGLEWTIIAKLLLIVSATMVSMALPLAILLSSLMTYGSLGEYFELTAMKSAGVSLQRAMRPILIFCFFMAVVAFYFSNNVLPIANLKMRSLLHDIRDKRPELNIKPGIFNNDLQDFVVRVGKKSNDGKILEDVMIYDHTKHAGNDRLIVAEKAYVEISKDQRYLEFRLMNGHSYAEADLSQKKGGAYPFLRDHFSENLIRFDRLLFALPNSDERLYKKNYQMLNLSQLEKVSDTLRMNYESEKELLINQLFYNSYFRKEGKEKSDKDTSQKNDAIKEESIASENDSNPANISLPAENKTDSLQFVKANDSASLVLVSDSLSVNQDSNAISPVRENISMKSKNLLANFSWDTQNRITESALNKLRNHKSILDFSFKNLEEQKERINRHEIEWQRKFSLSAACILLFLIGAPLGAIVRKGGLGMPVVISLIFFIVYYMLSITGEKLAREGVLSPLNGMWLSAYILFPVAIFITWKATHDSPLFNLEVYIRFFSRLGRFFVKATPNKG